MICQFYNEWRASIIKTAKLPPNYTEISVSTVVIDVLKSYCGYYLLFHTIEKRNDTRWRAIFKTCFVNSFYLAAKKVSISHLKVMIKEELDLAEKRA